MPSPIIISAISDKDLSRYARILEDQLGFSPEEALDYVRTKENVLKASIEGKLAGFLSYLSETTTSYYIDDLDVLKEFRKCGIGSKLLDYLAKKAQSENKTLILLHTPANNQAVIQFYQKNGFLKIEYLPHYYQQKFPAFLLQKKC